MSRVQILASAAALAVVLGTVGSANAQASKQEWVLHGSTNGDFYGNGNTYPARYAGYSPYVAPAPTYTSLYAPEPVVAADAALIKVKVPANAQVWLSGEKTQQTGANRAYVTPSLEAGHRYAYQVKVVWTDAQGRKVEREKKVPVRPGARVNLEFE